MNVASIDPGLSGAIAILSPNGELIHAERLPIVQHGSGELVEAKRLSQTLKDYNVVHTVIENVATRPGQGVSSQGTFMRAVGTVYGVAAVHASVSWVTPVVWKRHFQLLGKDKEASRALALTLFAELGTRFLVPKRKVLTLRQARDVADAALIGKWYAQTGGRTLTQLRKAALTGLPVRSARGQPADEGR